VRQIKRKGKEMTILEALKDKDKSLRIECGCRWLVWDEMELIWKVYEQKPYQKKSRVVRVSNTEEHAIEALLEG
jgi:hypothetical protein